jgi:DNA polymerase-3 subunit delta'
VLSDVQGQSEGVRFLRRVVEGHVTSPLLLVGTEGVGRRYSVTEAAKEAFSNGDPNNLHCVQISHGVHPDLVTVQPLDGKEIGIDAIREVLERVDAFPSIASVRYVIIDGADRMTTPAASALLKVLEEPCVTTRFFLLASSLATILPTIRSRCGLVRYRPLPEKFITDFLSKHTENATKALVCARLSEGSVGRAYQYLASGRLTLRNKMLSLLKAVVAGDISSLFSIVDDIDDDLPHGLRFFEHILYDLTMLAHDPSRLSNLDIAEELGGIRAQMTEGQLRSLLHELGLLRKRMQAPINLAFHVKTYLATFGG